MSRVSVHCCFSVSFAHCCFMVPVVLYELNDLYSLPIIVQVIKLRRMRWAWH